MDSMVNHYSVSKKRRQKDAYSQVDRWDFGLIMPPRYTVI